MPEYSHYGLTIQNASWHCRRICTQTSIGLALKMIPFQTQHYFHIASTNSLTALSEGVGLLAPDFDNTLILLQMALK